MTDESALRPGAFYWVRPAFDVDFTPPDFEGKEYGPEMHEAMWAHWWNNEQPALFLGPGKWVFLGQEEGQDWPVTWIGAEIKQ